MLALRKDELVLDLAGCISILTSHRVDDEQREWAARQLGRYVRRSEMRKIFQAVEKHPEAREEIQGIVKDARINKKSGHANPVLGHILPASFYEVIAKETGYRNIRFKLRSGTKTFNATRPCDLPIGLFVRWVLREAPKDCEEHLTQRSRLTSSYDLVLCCGKRTRGIQYGEERVCPECKRPLRNKRTSGESDAFDGKLEWIDVPDDTDNEEDRSPPIARLDKILNQFCGVGTSRRYVPWRQGALDFFKDRDEFSYRPIHKTFTDPRNPFLRARTGYLLSPEELCINEDYYRKRREADPVPTPEETSKMRDLFLQMDSTDREPEELLSIIYAVGSERELLTIELILKGYDYPGIAELEGIPISRVYNRISRLRQKVKKAS